MNGVKSSVRYLSEGELITGGRGRSVKGGGGVKLHEEGGEVKLRWKEELIRGWMEGELSRGGGEFSKGWRGS